MRSLAELVQRVILSPQVEAEYCNIPHQTESIQLHWVRLGVSEFSSAVVLLIAHDKSVHSQAYLVVSSKLIPMMGVDVNSDISPRCLK